MKLSGIIMIKIDYKGKVCIKNESKFNPAVFQIYDPNDPVYGGIFPVHPGRWNLRGEGCRRDSIGGGKFIVAL